MPKRTPPHHARAERPEASALAPITPRVGADIARNASAADDRIAQFLDSSDLAATVPLLQPETLHLLIRHRGLESCAGLVAAATPQQLNAVLDIDLWQPARAGEDDRLDVGRFGEWIETLCEAGDSVAAGVVAAMDPDIVAAALSAYIKVIDPATLAPSSGDGEWTDVAGLGELSLDLGGYVVLARTTAAWDAIVAVLLELDARDQRRFHAVMRRCRELSSSIPEIDGLDDLLLAPEQLLHDVAAARLQRRSDKGYVAPADARAFLQLARERGALAPGARREANPVAAAYLESAGDEEPAVRPTGPAHRDAAPRPLRERAEQIEAAAAALAGASSGADRPRALPGAVSPDPPRLTSIHALLEAARTAGDLTLGARERELAFVANALLAGSSIMGRPLTSQEASEAALATCNIGLEQWGRHPPAASPGAAAATRGAETVVPNLIAAFEQGWTMLHERVSMHVAEQLLATLASTRSHDSQIEEDLQDLKRRLETQWRNGTPWKAGESLEVIAILDQPIWVSLIGVLGECPVVPAALSATVERRTGAISATAFEFISTSGQIRQIETFMSRLGDLLVR